MPSNYLIELKSWLRKLEILQQENVALKNQIAEMLKNDVDSSAVDKVEYYLACFIEKDAVLALLRRDIADEMKHADLYLGQQSLDSMQKKQASLRKDIAQMEFEFYKLKAEFNDYLSHLTPAA